jgi:hypothetical protein
LLRSIYELANIRARGKKGIMIINVKIEAKRICSRIMSCGFNAII